MPKPFACDMTAIAAADRPLHHQLTRELVAEATIQPIEGGYQFELPVEAFDRVARFVSKERLCCPFLDFRIELSADREVVRLTLTGPSGASDFIRAELHLP
ncbi:MAG TPA: hypothetical protein VJN95_12340 [Gemmatimonadales bacterium]|nr:hypothetical protein [Gemmatimonadales bacterium]